MTTTEEQTILENSEQITVPENTPDTTVTKEPEIDNNEAVKKVDDIPQIDVPEKFKNKDGSANLSALIKSYKELEPLINEKANWSKEKETLTKEKESLASKIAQYESKKAFEMSKSDSTLLALGLYEKMLDKSTNSQKAKSLISEISKTFSEDKLKELETLFPTDVIKEVSINLEQSKQSLIRDHIKDAHQKEMQSAEKYLKDVVEKNFEDLKNPTTFKVFNDAFLAFGSNLDSEWFFSKIKELKSAFVEEYQKSQQLKKEKEDAVSIANSLTPKNSVSGGTPLSERNALDLSPQELKMMVEDYYKRN